MKYSKSIFKSRLTIVLLLLIIGIPTVLAFGVTSPYWDAKPLGLHPGQTIDFQLLLQNMVGNEDLTVKAEIIDGKEIVALLDSSPVYSVPLGVKDVPVTLRVTVPAEFPPDLKEIKRIGISFTPVRNGGEGEMVKISSAVKTDIPVEISPWVAKKVISLPLLFGGALLVLLIIVLGVMYLRRKEK